MTGTSDPQVKGRPAAAAAVPPALSPEDRRYLEDLARDTWACILSLAHPKTGLPYDKNDFSAKHTSVSNIGMYAADLVGAVELGLIPREEAASRAALLMDSVEKFKSWNGFCQSWNSVETREPAAHDTWISILDTGNMAGGLLAVKQAFPALKDRVGRYLDAMDWSRFYDPSGGFLYGGYDMKAGALNKDWKLTLLGSDSRLASLIAIGSGKVEPRHWDTLTRETETRHGFTYLAPGWQGGGLFMQYISGLFVDERATPMGLAAAAFARAQMCHARAIGSPVWGWSASDSPENGYLGWQAIKDNVVTPHASSLPLSFFPSACVANLRGFEALGARAPLAGKAFGFRDAVDLATKKVTDTYLVLDQSMLFLSIVQLLKDGAVVKHVERDPVVRRGRELVADFKNAAGGLADFWKAVDGLARREASS